MSVQRTRTWSLPSKVIGKLVASKPAVLNRPAAGALDQMLCACHCDSLLASLTPQRLFTLQRQKGGESFARGRAAMQRVASGQTSATLGYFQAGLPEMALAELPPKYIVSRMSQCAVAGVRAGQQRRRLK